MSETGRAPGPLVHEDDYCGPVNSYFATILSLSLSFSPLFDSFLNFHGGKSGGGDYIGHPPGQNLGDTPPPRISAGACMIGFGVRLSDDQPVHFIEMFTFEGEHLVVLANCRA